METNTLNFSNLENALNQFIKDFIDSYKTILIRDNKKASGNLINSLKPVSLEFKDNKYTASISLASYWKYVEYGRKPGKFPPPDKILDWIKIKPIIPRPNKGITPSQKQLAFLISRKIARDGIKAGNQFSETLNLVWAKNKDSIEKAIDSDLSASINLIKL